VAHSVQAIYKWPLVLGLITVAGLLFALLGDGLWDKLSWILLAIPLFVCGYHRFRGGKL
jgi:hypothetical protein